MEQQLRQINFIESITTLEQVKENSSESILTVPFSAEIVGIIGLNWSRNGNPYLQLISCQKYVDGTVSNEIVAHVRALLLKFMLKVDAEFGNLTKIEDLQKSEKQINHIMSQTIINTTGDGNLINTGKNSTITNKVQISKSNKPELLNYLNEIGVEQTDSSELITVLDEEQPDEDGKFGSKVNKWLSKMIGKALEGTWKVATDSAVSLLSEALKKYYGLS
jgi:hypothetical protein